MSLSRQAFLRSERKPAPERLEIDFAGVRFDSTSFVRAERYLFDPDAGTVAETRRGGIVPP
jgi:hypothetical protein